MDRGKIISTPRQRIIVGAIAIIVLGEFLADLYTPLGTADWVLYFIPLLMSVYVGGRFFHLALAAILTVAILLGYHFSPSGIDPRLSLIGRGEGIVVLWVMAFLILQHKRTVGQMRTSSRAVEQSPASIVITDKAGNIEYVNPKFVEVTGYSAAEVIGKKPSLLKSGETPPGNYTRLWGTITGGGEWRGEFHNRKKNGELFWESASISPISDETGDIAHFLAVKEDITERKRAEEEIREQSRLLDLAHDAIVVRDMDDRIRYWNQGAEQLFGWTADDVMGKPAWELLREEIFKHQEAMKQVLEKGRWSGELTCRAMDRRELTVETHLTLVRDAKGNPKSILGISTDITEKKKYEAQLFRSQRTESLGTLAGGIAHDFNNVLSPLLVSVQLLKEKVADDDGKRLLEALETNVLRGADLVRQVLAFGRGVAGERIILQPKHIVREIKQIINETFPKSVRFEFDSATDSWAIVGDPTQLHQVLLNLCVNSRDAMPLGGRLSIHVENIMFDEVYASMNPEAKAGPYVYLRVSDTGTGIPKAIQDKIYDPFFTTKEFGKGTGLGLSTTLAIVKSHGGFINCYSEPGEGTTFKVYFPASINGTAAESLTGGVELPRGNDELVLVVDDELSICQVAKKMLERYGYRVLLAADGAEAVMLYTTRRHEIDVVITDMAMPNMDGYATIGALKALNAKVKIVGSSGYASGASVTRINSSGVRHFVPKPYTAETMLGTLRDILQEGRAN